MITNFTFTETQLSRLFPFYIIIDRQLVVVSTGKSLENSYAITAGTLFFNNYKITQPEIATPDFESLKKMINQLLIIECFNEQHTYLKGQLDYLAETDQLIFIGVPSFNSIDEAAKNKLLFNDLAFNDVNRDLTDLIQTVSKQKDELVKANKTIKDIALFPIQNPDPIIRIDYNGDILQNNPAAAKLDFFEFENVIYRNDEFFKLIAARIDNNEGKWIFEASSEGNTYSFVCVIIKERNYINIYGRDITQSKRDRLQLNSLSLIIQQTQQAVVIADANGKVKWVNPAFEKVTGYTIEDVKDRTPGSFLQGSETDLETIKYMKRQIRKKKAFRCEVYNYKKSGEGYWKRINCHPVFDANQKLIQFFAIDEDITFEKEAQEKIKTAANRMSLLLSNLHAGILLVNENREIELVNQKFCKMFKRDENPDDMIGTKSAPTISEVMQFFKNPAFFESSTLSLINDKKIKIGEVFEMADGRFIERDFIPIWDEGKYKGHLVVYTDITDKINSDKKLKEQRIFYEEILDNIPADIAVFDTEHRYLYVNPKGGKDKDTRKWIIGKTEVDYVQYRNKPKEIAEVRNKLFDKILKGKRLQSWEEEIPLPDGSNQYMLRHMSPVINADEEVKMVIGYAVDISYTKSILLQIEESERRYRDVIENSLAIVTTHDMEGRFLTINPMGSKTFGYTDDEMTGHSIIEFMPEEDKIYFNSSYLDKIKEEKIFTGIFKVVHKSGETIYTLCNNFLKEEPGKEPYVIGFAMDITDRIKAEKELKIAKKITEELAQSKQNFLANMSHEIRTPMNAIMGMTNQLSKTLLSKDQQFYLNIIHSSSDNLLVIINDILDLSKIESGKLSLENIAFEPKVVMGRAMQVMMHKAEEKGLSITHSFCDTRMSEVLLGDPYRLNQILLNLISNAVKFTEKGSIDIKCNLIDENDMQQTIQVSVKDTGIGMDESFAQKVFTKYTQENESNTRIFGGTGLGMSICEELIQLMGGKIFVDTKKGIGTTISFIITFGKGTRDQLLEKEVTKVDTEIINGKKILITDDNMMNRLVASTILNNYGATIKEAKNGLEAIEKIKNENFDIVLMDVQMPVMGGVEATQEIRKNISSTLPIIALTAFAIKGDNTKFIEAGMSDYLSKPFKENQLLQMICSWLEKIEITVPKKILNKPATLVYDLTKLHEISRGNTAFVEKMVNLFVNQVRLAMIEINTAYQENDFSRIRNVAHRIKPAFDNMGIVSLKSELQQMEFFAMANKHSPELARIIQHFETAVKKVIVAIQSGVEQ